MLWAGLVSLAAVGVAAQDRVASRPCYHHLSEGGTIYDFEELDLFETRNVSLSEYRGQYHQLNELHNTLGNLTVLAFPCNQFGKQEPASNGDELMNGIKHVRPGSGFEPTFPVFKKVDVNGEEEHPLYTYLKAYCPTTRHTFADASSLSYTPLKIHDVRWNWEKFLITKSGKPFMRYDPGTEPQDIRKDIVFLLQQPA